MTSSVLARPQLAGLLRHRFARQVLEVAARPLRVARLLSTKPLHEQDAKSISPHAFRLVCLQAAIRQESRLAAAAGSSGGEGGREHYRTLRASGGGQASRDE
jgi:hypothetical protein